MDNYVITIGRQSGSGGSLLGRSLAEHFGFRYIDNDLLKKAAKELHVPEADLERMDEKESLADRFLFQPGGYPMAYMSDDWKLTTGEDLFNEESNLIRQAVEQAPCVVVGRCGSYLFSGNDRHVSLFLHADEEQRAARLAGSLEISREKAVKMIHKLDKARARYVRTFTGREWQDPASYDLSIHTGRMSEDQVKELAVHYICSRFPELKKR